MRCRYSTTQHNYDNKLSNVVFLNARHRSVDIGNETSRLIADISTMLVILLTGKQHHCIVHYVTGHYVRNQKNTLEYILPTKATSFQCRARWTSLQPLNINFV